MSVHLFSRGAKPGSVLLTSGTVSAAATLDLVLTAYTAYRAIEIMLGNFRPATDGVSLVLRHSTNGGSSYDAGASDYAYALNLTTGGGANAPTGSTGTTGISMNHPSALIGSGSAEGWSGKITLHDQVNSAAWARATIEGAYVDNTATPQLIAVFGAGFRLAAQDTDAIRLLFSSGNIQSGSYGVYGYA